MAAPRWPRYARPPASRLGRHKAGPYKCGVAVLRLSADHEARLGEEAMNRRWVIVFAALLTPLAAHAQTTLNLMNFPCGGNLPQLVAQERGFYAREGLAVTARPAPSSVALVRGLMDGSVDLGLAA